MSRWILRTAVIFCGLLLLSAAAFLFLKLGLAESPLLVVLLGLTVAAFLTFAILFTVGTWRKWRKQRLGR